MGYQALYRKYRPSNFLEVCGQNTTIKILKNSISKNKISHAYLFYGPRGTGKTSTAKIFAKAINCLNPKDGVQCNECESCKISNSSECLDIIEIDAASNNGVDEIRELKSKVNFVPSALKYKVYIIDEVHMLSTGAFNALLKTLEEPPEYVIFILATTEFSKVPSTIVSRCQTLEFKKISDDNIVDRLRKISDEEKINIDDDALLEIAKNSNGGLRDSIGLLEKANSFTDKIDKESVRLISGNISEEERNEFLKCLSNKDITGVINKINEYSNSGADLSKIIYDLINYYTNEYIKDMNNNTNMCSIIFELDSIYSNMIKSENPKLILEVSILNLFSSIDNNRVVKSETTTNIEKVKNDSTVTNIDNSNKIADNNNKSDFIQRRVYNTLSKPDKTIINEIRSKWKKISDLAFDEKFGNISRLLVSDIKPVAASDEYIVLVSKLNGLSEQINDDINSVEKIIEKVFNNKYKAVCISESDWNNYIDLYKKDKSLFVYNKEEISSDNKKKSTLKDKAKELFED
jgi:DNA polymerase-3 subunit gamma/tau